MDAEATIDTPVPAISSGSLQSLNLGAYSLAELAELVNWTNAKEYQSPSMTPWVEAGSTDASAPAAKAAVPASNANNPFVEGNASEAEEADASENFEPDATEVTGGTDTGAADSTALVTDETHHDSAEATEMGAVTEVASAESQHAAALEHGSEPAAETQMAEVEDHFAAVEAVSETVDAIAERAEPADVQQAANPEVEGTAAAEGTAASADSSPVEQSVEAPQPMVHAGADEMPEQSESHSAEQPGPEANNPTSRDTGSAIIHERPIERNGSRAERRSSEAGRPAVGATIQPTQRTPVAGLPNRRAATMAAVENGETAALADYLRQLEGLVLDLNMQIAQGGNNGGDQADYTQRLCQRVIELSLENKALHEKLQSQQ